MAFKVVLTSSRSLAERLAQQCSLFHEAGRFPSTVLSSGLDPILGGTSVYRRERERALKSNREVLFGSQPISPGVSYERFENPCVGGSTSFLALYSSDLSAVRGGDVFSQTGRRRGCW